MRQPEWRAVAGVGAAGLLAGGLLLVVQFARLGWEPTAPFFVGTSWGLDEELAARELEVGVTPGNGYDGQWFLGLAYDPALGEALASSFDMPRYRAGRPLQAVVGWLLAVCGGSGGDGSASGGATATSGAGAATTTSGSSAAGGEVSEVPEETAGPYPGDGSNGPNVLDDSGIVRTDIRSSFGSSTTTAEGVPLTIKLTVRDAATGDVAEGAGVYLWHCDRDGNYSLYSPGVTGENYLRGAQEVDASGTVTFQSIFPACYSGRWPHIHLEVYASLSDATSSGPIVKTSQIALPKEACEAVYATSGYEQSVANMAQGSLAGDNVFGDDGGIHQIATMSGDAGGGYTAALTVGV